MRFIKGLLFWILFASIGSVASYFVGNVVLPSTMKPENLAAGLAVFKLKQSNPFATAEDVQKLYSETPKGIEGLAAFLAEQAKPKSKVDKDSVETYLDSLDDGTLTPAQQTAMNKRQEEIRKQVAAIPKASEAAPGEKQPDIYLTEGTAGVDPSAEDKIMQMTIPDSVKKQILDNYHRTGILPSLVSDKVENRLPATSDSPIDSSSDSSTQHPAYLTQ